ncbi:MAG: hypothetical protein AAF356_09930 [Planctomycetota bacterium]
MRPTRSTIITAAAAALFAPSAKATTPAHTLVPRLAAAAEFQAQNTDPRAILESARDALLETGAFQADMQLLGEGADLFKNLLPTATGTLRYARGPLDGADVGVLRVAGQLTEGSGKPPRPFDASVAQGVVRSLTELPRRVYERRTTDNAHTSASIVWLLRLDELATNPLAQALASPELSIEPPREVDGVMCDVVFVAEPQREESGPARPGQGFTHARWFIAQSDRLPRRIERVNKTNFGDFSLILQLTGLAPIPGATPADLVVRVPEGVRLDSTVDTDNNTGNAEPTNDLTDALSNRNNAAKPSEPTQPSLPARPLAPGFEIERLDTGEPVSTGAQIDSARPTLLWFWGTWSLASQRELPMLTEALADLSDRIDAVALAAPPADEARVLESAGSLIPALATRAQLDAFEILVFPTAVVIDAEGRLVGRVEIDKDTEPSDRAAEIVALIREALGEAVSE